MEEVKETKEVKERKLKVIDKRRVGKSECVEVEEPNLKPTYVQQLEEKVKRMEIALKNKIEELEEEAKRSRERVAKDLEKRYEERFEKLLLDLFVIFESLDKAIELSSKDEKVKEGLTLIKDSLDKFLENQGVEKIEPINEDFDPILMEAIQLADGEKDKVVGVLQNGYKKGERVLKPAKVVVGKG